MGSFKWRIGKQEEAWTGESWVDEASWKAGQGVSAGGKKTRVGPKNNGEKEEKKIENAAEKEGKLSLSCQWLNAPVSGTIVNFNKIFYAWLQIMKSSVYTNNSKEYISTTVLISTS